jgi:hypothetical protein
MYEIQPTSLTHDELLRACNNVLSGETLPLMYQRELVKRFESLLNEIDDLRDELEAK